MTDIVILPAVRLDGAIRVPGDKSISHRALLLSVLATGRGFVENLSAAEDVRSTWRALSALNPKQQVKGSIPTELLHSSEFQLLVDGLAARPVSQTEAIDVGNSGTTIRLLAGILAGLDIAATLTGDHSIRRRPMARVVDPLRAMGADINTEAGGLAPIALRGSRLHGLDHNLPVASAQVKSALLLAGTQASGETSVREPSISRDHTERMLAAFGCDVARDAGRLIVKSTNLQMPSVISVPGDFSSAAPLLAAAAILPGSDLQVLDVGVNPTRTGLLDLLRLYGAAVEVTDVQEVSNEPRGTIRVRSGDRRPMEVSAAQLAGAIDELPLVAILGAFADGETVLTDASELRVKESDRIATTCALVEALGGSAQPLTDGFVIRGSTAGLRGGRADAHGDHRIAMAAAVAALASSEPVRVSGWEAVAVSYPNFADDLEQVVIR